MYCHTNVRILPRRLVDAAFALRLAWRRRARWSVLLTLLIAPAALAQTVTFNYTGAVQSYTVPVGAVAVTIQAYGAGGGGGGSDQGGAGAAGGAGALASATYTVAAGNVLEISVGGGGGARLPLPAYTTAPTPKGAVASRLVVSLVVPAVMPDVTGFPAVVAAAVPRASFPQAVTSPCSLPAAAEAARAAR